MLCTHENRTEKTTRTNNTVNWFVNCNDCDFADGEIYLDN